MGGLSRLLAVGRQPLPANRRPSLPVLPVAAARQRAPGPLVTRMWCGWLDGPLEPHSQAWGAVPLRKVETGGWSVHIICTACQTQQGFACFFKSPPSPCSRQSSRLARMVTLLSPPPPHHKSGVTKVTLCEMLVGGRVFVSHQRDSGNSPG